MDQQKTYLRKAVWCLFFLSLIIFLGFSIFYTADTIHSAILREPGWSFLPISIILIFMIATIIALSIFMVGLPLIILFFALKAKLKGEFESSGIKKWWVILSLILIIILISGFTLFLYRSSVLQKAESLDTSPEALAELSNHVRLDVRRAVAKNPNTPQDILYKLYEEKLESGYRAHTESLTKNPKTPPDIIHKIYEDPETLEYITYNIAQNPNTPEDIIRELAEQAGYKFSLARNPNLPADLVDKLRNDPNKQVREAVTEVHGG